MQDHRVILPSEPPPPCPTCGRCDTAQTFKCPECSTIVCANCRIPLLGVCRACARQRHMLAICSIVGACFVAGIGLTVLFISSIGGESGDKMGGVFVGFFGSGLAWFGFGLAIARLLIPALQYKGGRS